MSIVGITIVAAPEHAAADTCTDKEQIFVRSTASRTNTQGTINKIELRNRDLENNCMNIGFCNSTIVFSLSTAHIQRDASQGSLSGDWVEIGWVEHWALGGGKTWGLFTEKGFDGQMAHCQETSAPNLDIDTYDLWRIGGTFTSGGTREWNLKVDFINGNGYVDVRTYTTAWDWGVALGETERRGVGTGMSDDQKELKFKNSNGNWVSWPGVNCIIDQGPLDAWEWNPISASHYEVIKTGGGC